MCRAGNHVCVISVGFQSGKLMAVPLVNRRRDIGQRLCPEDFQRSYKGKGNKMRTLFKIELCFSIFSYHALKLSLVWSRDEAIKGKIMCLFNKKIKLWDIPYKENLLLLTFNTIGGRKLVMKENRSTRKYKSFINNSIEHRFKFANFFSFKFKTSS